MKNQKWGILLAGVLLFAGGGAALAQEPTDGPPDAPQHGPRGPRVFGQVTAITESAVTAQGPRGETQTIYVNAETQLARLEKPATLSEFKVGDFIGARGETDERGQFNAIQARGGDQPPQRGPGGPPPGQRP
jgi:hypothetical protein